jgi:hypothetical protein
VSVRLVLIVCTDQMVHVVFAGSETGVQQHQFPYGTLDAEAKVFTVVPQLTSKNGRPVLVMPRLKGSEKKWDDMFRWPPQMRNPNLASGPSAPVPGWYVDPTARHQLRYWDGAAWTATAADNGQSVIDPM